MLGHLADEPRLRVFAAVLLGAASAEEVARRSGVPARQVPRLLSRLESAGLVAREAGRWLARPEVLRSTVAAATSVPEPMDHGVSDQEEAAVLRAFLPNGRLERIPAARSKRLVVLDHVCRVFEPGQRYPEREVVAMLRAFHEDHAALRRYLVDEGFLSRDPEGVYWRSGGTVVV